MQMITDFHAHILPGIDDGSKSIEQSVLMLQQEAAQKIGHIVATPHFYADQQSPNSFLENRMQAETRLRKAIREFPNLPSLSVGAEVYFFDGISTSELLPQLTIGNTNAILIEMPMSDWSERNLQELTEIYEGRGLIPIIAHLDRYIRPFHTKGLPERLAELPVLVQANASFFLAHKTRRLAFRLLRQNKIHLLGSDCHNLSTRPPNLGDALNAIRLQLGDQIIERIATQGNDLFSKTV